MNIKDLVVTVTQTWIMKNGQIEKLEETKVEKVKNNITDKVQPRIYEFIQGVNGMFSNKRLLAIVFAMASIAYAFFKSDPIIVGIFATAATGSSVGGVLEKKQD